MKLVWEDKQEVAVLTEFRAEAIKNHVCALFSSIHCNFKQKYLSKKSIQFLKDFLSWRCYIPNNFFFKAELDRLRFGKEGNLLNVAEKRKALLFSLVIIRIFIEKVLTKPEGYYSHFEVNTQSSL